MIVAFALAVAAVSAPFDLHCTGRTRVVHNGQVESSMEYEDVISLDIGRGLYSDSTVFAATPVKRVDESFVILSSGVPFKGAFNSQIIDRLTGQLAVQYFLGPDRVIKTEAACKRQRFSRWDHRAF